MPRPDRLLLVHPGASYSVQDVYSGLRPALEAFGDEVVAYQTDSRIEASGRFLSQLVRRQNRGRRPDERLPKPTSADVLYDACLPVLERALRFDVAWVVVVSGMYFHPDFYVFLRRAGRRVAVILTESPYDQFAETRIAPHVDLLTTNERVSVAPLRVVNPRTYYLPWAYDPRRHFPRRRRREVPRHDVVFVGSGFPERIRLLEGVDWTGIDLGLYGAWRQVGSRSPIRRFIRSREIDNAAAVELYRAATLGLNLYRTSVGFGRHAPAAGYAESMNLRTYELAACGLFFLSGDRAECRERFGDLVPTFRSSGELEEGVRYWLDRRRKGERRERAEGLRRVVQDDTWDARATSLRAWLARGAA